MNIGLGLWEKIGLNFGIEEREGSSCRRIWRQRNQRRWRIRGEKLGKGEGSKGGEGLIGVNGLGVERRERCKRRGWRVRGEGVLGLIWLFQAINMMYPLYYHDI